MSLTYQKLPDPVLRTWEVNETNTRYEYYQAQPSDNALRIQFIVLASTNALVAVATSILIYSVVKSAHLRVNPFNWYLVFITVPDFVMSFCCLFTCALSAPIEEFYSEWMCSFQSMFLTFGLCANCWMNFFIVFEVHKLLRHSNYRRRYTPPKRTTVMKQAFGVYLYAIVWGLLGIFPIDWLPLSTYLWYGFYCFPQEYNLASTLFFWLVLVPAIMGIPIFYVTYVCFDIWKRNLLPPQGRRRNLAIFFVRLICVYFIMWAPTVVVRIICNFWDAGAWVSWAGAFWTHMQGFVSVVVAMSTKGDIRKAVMENFECCLRPEPEVKDEDTAPVQNSSRRTRRSLGISVMKSFNRVFPPSYLRGSTLGSEQRVLDALEDCAEDRDLTDSAAMQAIDPAFQSREARTSTTFSEHFSYLSGFEDDDDDNDDTNVHKHVGYEHHPRAINEDNDGRKLTEDTKCCQGVDNENPRDRVVAFCLSSNGEDCDDSQGEEDEKGENMASGS